MAKLGSGKNVSTFSSTTTPFLPSQAQPLFDVATQQWGEAQRAVPTIAEQYGQIPLLDIANLTPEQEQYRQQLQMQGGASPELQRSYRLLEQLTSGPIGSSPLTQEGIKAYQSQVIPTLIQQQSAAGRGSGGATLESIAQGTQSAYIPFLVQEMQNRAAAVGQYQQLQQNQIRSIAAALEAAGMPREVANQQAAAQYAQEQQRLEYANRIQTMPAQLIPQLIGSTTTGRSTSKYKSGWGDYVGGTLGVLGGLLSIVNPLAGGALSGIGSNFGGGEA